MLRTNKLLPFGKGVRNWLVAGTVSKTVPLDGTVNPSGAEDGKSEQGHHGNKSPNSTERPLHVAKVGDGSFRQSPKATGVSSPRAKFEKIHKHTNGAFLPEPCHARASVVGTSTIPSRINVALPPASVEHHRQGITRHASPVDPSLPVIASGPTIQTPKIVRVLVAKAQVTEPEGRYAASKAADVGLATLSRISDQAAVSKDGRIPTVSALDVESSSGLPPTTHMSNQVEVSKDGAFSKVNASNVESTPGVPLLEAGRRGSSVIQSSVAIDRVTALQSSDDGKKSKESRPVTSLDVVSRGNVLPALVRTPTSGSNSKISTAKELTESTKNDIVNSAVSIPHYPLSNVEGEASHLAKVVPLKPSPHVQYQEVKYSRSSARGSKPGISGGVNGGGQRRDISSQKPVGSSKPKDSNTGTPGTRRKVSGYGQAGPARQSQWSGKDSGWEGTSSEMVRHVGGILRRMGWTSQTVDALAPFNSRLSTFHINEILKDQREPGLAWEFFSWAKRQSGYKHDVRTYTTMIGILGRARNFEACDMLMKDMQREGCEPSVVTFNRLIHAYGRANYLGESLKIFKHMQDIGCQPDRVTYCTLIDLHSKAGLHDVAMEICHKMWEAGFRPDTFSYSLIIHCLGKAGNLPGAYKMFLEMIENGCTPNLVTYNIMIDLHAKEGKYHMALKLYNDLQDAGYRPDKVTYSVIVEVLGHSGHLEEAENVFNEMEQSGWIADSTIFGSLVYMWGQAGNIERATFWYKKMIDSGLSATVPTCNSLLWAYMRVNDYEAASDVLKNMFKCGLTPTLPTYTLLLSGCTLRAHDGDIDSMLQIMSLSGHRAHDFLCRLIHELDGEESEAHVCDFFDSLHEEEHASKRSFADALIEFFYQLDLKDRAGCIWEVAVKNNLYPSAVSQRSPNYWIVDLHLMSMGTAVVAMLRTLAGFRERMISTGVLPDRIEIVTGWGRHSRVSGFSKIKNVVENILGALHAPFYVDSSNVGCFVGTGEPLVEWLHRPNIDYMLTL